MKTRLTPVRVVLSGCRPVRVEGRRVLAVLAGYMIQGRWWARETRRRYVRVRIEEMGVVDLFEQEGRWFIGAEHD